MSPAQQVRLYFFLTICMLIQCKEHPQTDSQTSSKGDSESIASLAMEASQHYDRDNFAVALRLYDKIIEMDSLNGEAHYRKGYCLVQLDRHEESFDCYLNAIELNYRKYDSYRNLAYNYLLIYQDTTKAIYFLNLSLELQRNDEDSTLANELVQAKKR
jgi:tetratricopeptide (TPR) repeat protein